MNTIMRWLVVEKSYTGYTEQDEEVKRTYTESPILQYKPVGYGPWITVPAVKIPFEELTYSDDLLELTDINQPNSSDCLLVSAKELK